MAVRRIYKKRFKGVPMKSGYFYTFRYQAWENDPSPTIILMYFLEGTHQNTGHQWRIIQAINFTYIPRSIRKRFIDDWSRILQQTNDVRFTWQLVKRKYPWLQVAVRRYFYKPNYYIKGLKEIPLTELDKYVVSTWHKDFSKKVKTTLINKFRGVMQRRKAAKQKASAKKTKKNIRKGRRI